MTSYKPARSHRRQDRELLNPVEWLLQFLHASQTDGASHSSIRVRSSRHRWRLRSSLSTIKILMLLWLVILYWGERIHFTNKVANCDWALWEDWPEHARPHRLFLVADPQLVDPHTYPGRPWPLSSLTMSFTDHYLSRVFRLSTMNLQPQTVMFLGDLFDGGREWATADSQSPDKQFRKYGYGYWINEYKRFGNIFLTVWEDFQRKSPKEHASERKFIASLPGNHDLGFATGIQEPVRKRFNIYFGDGNSVDIIGNHTFIGVDTVSLSAMDTTNGPELWRPTADFLDDNQQTRARAVGRALKRLHGYASFTRYDQSVVDFDDFKNATLPAPETDIHELPLILLTHVPLYRDPGTPCGPLREHWPPSPVENGQQPLLRDDRNAIRVAAGYQYQNVLSQTVTAKIIKTLKQVQYAFSGDDHDYCELHHSDDSSAPGVREITVKSISMAMGVRRPGFLQVSLFNPVDVTGKTSLSEDEASKPTVQTNLCLLPDQLGILLRYLICIVFTIIVLAVRAISSMSIRHPDLHTTAYSLLPTVREEPKAEMEEGRPSNGGSGSATPISHPTRRHRATSSLASISDLKLSSFDGHGSVHPGNSHTTKGSDLHSNGTAKLYSNTRKARRSKSLSGWNSVLVKFLSSLAQVGLVAGLWYWWLMSNG